MSGGHKKVRCRHCGRVTMQCRCIGHRTTEWTCCSSCQEKLDAGAELTLVVEARPS